MRDKYVACGKCPEKYTSSCEYKLIVPVGVGLWHGEKNLVQKGLVLNVFAPVGGWECHVFLLKLQRLVMQFLCIKYEMEILAPPRIHLMVVVGESSFSEKHDNILRMYIRCLPILVKFYFCHSLVFLSLQIGYISSTWPNSLKSPEQKREIEVLCQEEKANLWYKQHRRNSHFQKYSQNAPPKKSTGDYM